jgi:IclR family transcriptional regulator, acetate operon repressor
MARWTQVLSAFVRQDEWHVRELARETGLSRSAAHRILHEMRRLDLLSVRPEGGFVVGPALARLATRLSARVDILRIARPVLESTMEKTGETVVIAQYVPSQRQVWPLDAVESPHPVRFIWDSLPEWRELHIGATGKGVLAFLPETERDSIIASLPDPIVAAAPQTKAQLATQLAQARKQGYVTSRGESFAGGIAVAAPVLDASATVIGDVVISWPDSRTGRGREHELGLAAISAAADISRGLGYVDDRPRGSKTRT